MSATMDSEPLSPGPLPRAVGQAYRREVQLFLLLSFGFFIAMNLLSAWALLSSRRTLGEEFGERCYQVSVFVERALLAQELASWSEWRLPAGGEGSGSASIFSPSLRQASQDWALVGIEVVDGAGSLLAASHAGSLVGAGPRAGPPPPTSPRPGPSAGSRLAVLDASARRDLEIGSWVLSPIYEPAWAAGPIVSVVHRLSKSPLVFLKLDFDAGMIGERDRWIRTLVWISAGSSIVLVLLLYFFMHRVLAPYDALMRQARAAERFEPPSGNSPERVADETQYLVSTFERTIATLESKERELAQLHRRALERVDELEVLTDTLSRNLPSGLLTLDGDARLLAFNQSGRDILGLQEGHLGMPIAEALTDAPEFAALIRGAFEGIAVERQEVAIEAIESPPGSPAKRGERLWLGVTASAIRDHRGRRLGVLVLFSDLTPLKALEERMRLRDNLANLGEFSAGIAHEFRNSLATILGYSRLLEKDSEESERQRHLSLLRAESEHMNQVIQQFLVFARPRELQVTEVSLADLVEEVCAQGTHARVEGDGAAEVDIGGDFAVVMGDEVLLRQALANLIVNAIEATRAAGSSQRVRVTGEIVEGAGVQSGAAQTAIQRRQFIRVHDRGNGIGADALSKVFLPFYTTKEQGTGMGLALVHKIAILHGGDVEVTSSPENGTIFLLSLPIASA